MYKTAFIGLFPAPLLVNNSKYQKREHAW